MEKIITSLKNYWFLITALVALSGAWATSQVKIQSLEEAVKQNITTQSQVNELKAHTERIDERTKALYDSNARQERMLEMLLNNSQRSQIMKEKNR